MCLCTWMFDWCMCRVLFHIHQLRRERFSVLTLRADYSDIIESGANGGPVCNLHKLPETFSAQTLRVDFSGKQETSCVQQFNFWICIFMDSGFPVTENGRRYGWRVFNSSSSTFLLWKTHIRHKLLLKAEYFYVLKHVWGWCLKST